MELWPEVQGLDAGLTGQLRLELPCDMQVSSNPQTVANIPQASCLPLVQPVVRLPEKMSQCVVICYDKELKIILQDSTSNA
jgi:hypothetical protein